MMSNRLKSLFPACASFGPILLALGPLMPNRDGTPYGLIVTIPGALMTTSALLMVFRAMAASETSASSPEQPSKPKA